MLLQRNTLSDIVSAEDGADVFSSGGIVPPNYFSGGTDPLAGKPAYSLDYTGADTQVQTLGLPGPAGAPPAASMVAAVQAQLDAIQPAGGLQGAWYSVRNFFQYSLPGLFTSASTKVRGWFGAPTTVTTVDGKTGATSTSIASSSWMLYVFLAGAAVAVYYATKGKGKGGKSFLTKLGGGSGVKLH